MKCNDCYLRYHCDEQTEYICKSNDFCKYIKGTQDTNNKCVIEKSWEEFRDSGLLWFINTILHMFGWAICINIENNKVISAYPARVTFRGFNEETNTIGYQKVTAFLKQNINQLLNESME